MIVAVVALAVVLVVSSIRSYINIGKVPGTYLAEGGVGCYIIERRGLSQLAIEKVAVLQEGEYEVSFAGSRLRLECSSTPPRQWNEVREMLPSRAHPGDWDIVAYGGIYRLLSGRPGLEGWIEQFRAKWFPVHAYPKPLPRRLPYLHRVKDWRVATCFSQLDSMNTSLVTSATAVSPSSMTLSGMLRRARQAAAERHAQMERTAAYRTAQSLLRDYPNDLYVRMMYLCVAARSGNVEEVGRRLEEWKNDIKAADDPYLSWTYNSAESWHRAHRLSAAGRNAYDLCQKVLSPETDLPTRLKLFPEVLEKDALVLPWIYGQKPEPWLGFLDIQIAVKIFRAIATFDMFTGEREESLRLLSASARLGQMLTQDGATIPRLIGATLMSLAGGGLELYALNCCETEAEFRQLWETLEMLEKRAVSVTLDEVISLESPIYFYYQWSAIGLDEPIVRLNHANSRFELLRMATAAKYRLVTQGSFPKSADQFAPFLPQGPPKDPFGDGPLKFLSTTDSLTCYSIGPDKNDNRATIAYDPTNGTISGGDILLKVPREREYPFPRGGVRAASVDDLWRQFPNGLPRDPFASTRGKGLGTTMTAAGDVYVYSYGPDVDEFKGQFTGTSHVLQAHYDPTNGIVSEGDLFIRLPRP